MSRFRPALIASGAAVALTYVFWQPLWHGGGFIGGDLYTYFFPQKAFFAERLAAGEFPLWNNRSGHGYPLIAESQTAALYPPNPLLYATLDVNTAYHASHLLHYVLTFLFTWLYAQRFGLSNLAGLFTALVYTYSWFPPRCCLEWAIIGGTYLPLALWCVESFLQTRLWRYLIGLSLALGLQMLAGHYNLAFITQLVLAAYVPLRLWFADRDFAAAKLHPREADRASPPAPKLRLAVALASAMLLGFGVAAVQLVPTWELKVQSQRADVGASHNPGYGHLPAWYWSQIVAPWKWYLSGVELDQQLNQRSSLSIAADTNKVEAHLYFGMVPLFLMLGGAVATLLGLRTYGRKESMWFCLGLAALTYTPGWLLPITEHLPGFSFFMGPGRYGIVTTLAVALLAGKSFDEVCRRLSGHLSLRTIFAAFVLVATTIDLWSVSRLVTYAVMLEQPPIKVLDQSQVARILKTHASPVRLYAPGPNLPQLLGAASTPPYLGLGPAVYYDPDLKIPVPELPRSASAIDRFVAATPDKIDWLQRTGVTHVLSEQPLDTTQWPAREIWRGFDIFLNHAWARDEPLYLYELQGTRGRAALLEAKPTDTARVADDSADRIVVETDSDTARQLVLTDLDYPGWSATVNGKPAPTIRFEGMYRAVQLPPGHNTVVWTYRPRSVYWWGTAASALTLLFLAAIAHVRFWHDNRLRWLDAT